MSKKTEKILALLDKGLKPTEVAKKVKVSAPYVYALRSKTKAKAKKKPGRPKKEWTQISEIVVPVEALLEASVSDLVNHPEHYTHGGFEVIDFIEAKDLNYRLGNVVKYISRADKKVGGDPLRDLEKAAFYLNREIAVRKSA